MKLVELLARELSEWPAGLLGNDGMTQDKCGDLNTMDTGKSPDFHAGDGVWHGRSHSFLDGSNRVEVASDYAAAVVTKEQWQAERDKQKGGEWKRHRGGSVPVDALAVVEVKLRDATLERHRAECFNWRHDKTPDDIMSYRVISQPQAEEVEVNAYLGDSVKLEISHDGVNFSEIGTARIDNICDLGPAEPQWQQSTGPLAWRDTIIHCQAIIEDCEREIQANVNLLDSEGLFMQLEPKKGMQAYDVPAVDMGDWRNWRVGDHVRVAQENDEDVVVGTVTKVTRVEHPDYRGDLPVMIEGDRWPGKIEGNESEAYNILEFIRRP